MVGGTRSRTVVLVVLASVAALVSPLAGSAPAGAAASPVVPFRSADALVRQQFRDFQGRNATTSEVAPFLSGLADGSVSAPQTVDEIAHTGTPPERNGNVTRLYTAYFQRLPDIGGLEYWINKSASGWTLNKISGNFAGSSEFVRKYGSLSNAGFVDRAFQNVFGRAADPGGRAYWIGKLDKGLARGAVMVGFSQSSEYQRKQGPTVEMVLAYRGLLRRIPTGTEATGAVARVQADGFAALAGDLMALTAYADRFPTPGKVTSLVVYPGDGKASLEWKPAATNGVALAGYTLRIFGAGGIPMGDRSLAANATSTTITGLTNGQSYSFAVVAYNANRDGLAVTSSSVVVNPEVVWSTFQGNPAHTGVQPRGTVPASPTKKWVAPFERPIQQVVVGDGRIFAVTEGVHAGSTTDGSSVYALDPADGSVLWGPVVVDGGSYGVAYLGYENRRVFVSSDEGLIMAMDSASGNVLWSVNLGGYIWEQRGLTVADGTLYTWDGNNQLVAINTANGATRWHADTMEGSGTPGVDASGIYVSQTCDYSYRFNTAGQKIWSTAGDCTGGGSGTSTLAGGRIWATGGYLDKSIRSQTNGAKLGTPLGGEAPAVSGSTVLYDDNATLRGVDWASGAVLWSQAGDGSILGSPVVNAGRTYVRTSKGKVYSYNVADGIGAWSHNVLADLPGEVGQYDAAIGDLAIGDGLLLVPVTVSYPDTAGAVVAYG